MAKFKPLDKEQFLKKLENQMDRCEAENYHTEGDFLYRLSEKVRNASDDDWKDVAINEITKFGP